MASASSHHHCGPCERDNEFKDASNWCSTCGEGLCFECLKDHKKNKASSKHVVCPIADVNQLSTPLLVDWNICETHKDQDITLYCRFHASLCCTSCIPESHRSCDDVIPIENASKNIRESFALSDLRSRIQGMIGVYDVVLRKKSINVNDVLKQAKSIENKIVGIESNFKKSIEQRRNDVSAKANEIITSLTNETEKMSESKMSLENVLKDLSTLKNLPSDQHMFVAMKRLDSDHCRREKQMQEEKDNLGVLKSIHYDGDITSTAISQLLGDVEIRSKLGNFPELTKLMQCQVSAGDTGNLVLNKNIDLQRFVEDPEVWKLCYFPDHKKIVLTDSHQRCLYIVDIHRESVDVMELGKNFSPWYVCFFDKNHALVASGDKLILRIDILKKSIKERFSGGYPICLVGNYLVYSEYNEDLHTIVIRPYQSRNQTTRRIKVGVEVGYMCAYGSDKFVYSSYYGSKVECMKLTGESVFKLKITHPVGVTVDRNYFLYVAKYHNNDIIRINPSGTIDKTSTLNYYPLGLAYNKTEHKLIDNSFNVVHIYDIQ